jgi:hypothetical protein
VKSAREQILASLPGTRADVRRKSGLHRATVLRWMARLHEEEKAIHIARWKPHPIRGPAMAVFAAGSQPDVECALPKLTKHEVYERFRARIKRDGRIDVLRAKDRNKYWKKKAVSAPRPWFAALM